MIIDYIDGQLNDSDRTELEKVLLENREARELYEQLSEVLRTIDRSADLEPGKNLKTGFDKILEEESSRQKSSKTIFFQPVVYRAAAAVALVAAGIFVGFWINKNQQQADQIAALQKEVIQTKQMMMSMLENHQSASQRMIGPVQAPLYQDPTTGLCTITYSAVTSVTVAAINLQEP